MKRYPVQYGIKWSLAVVLAAGVVLTGCSGSGSKEAEKGSPTEDPNVKKGELTVSVYDSGDLPPEIGTADDNMWTKWIQEKAPVNVKFMPIARLDSDQKFNVLLASGTAPDLILEFKPTMYNELYQKKQLLPLDDLIEKHSTVYKDLLKKYPNLKKATTMPDGKMYTFAQVSAPSANTVMLIRKDWLDKLQLQAPQTIDDFYKVAKAFAEKDPDGNGKADTIGYTFSETSLGTLMTAFGTDPQNYHTIKDGKVVNTLDRSLDGMALASRMYEEKLVDKDFVTDKTGAKSLQEWTNGKVGMVTINIKTANFLQRYEAFKKAVPTGQIMAIPLPETKYGSYSRGFAEPYRIRGAINVAAKDPVAVIKYIDFILSESSTMTLNYGHEGVHYTKGTDGCPKPIDQAKNTKELSFLPLSLGMLQPETYLAKCSPFYSWTNPDIPAHREYAELLIQANKASIDPKRPRTTLTPNAYMPALPNDLQLSLTNLNKTVNDAWVKSIVSGASYTPEQAMKDIKSAWEKNGGTKLDEWYSAWYQDSKAKGSALFSADSYGEATYQELGDKAVVEKFLKK